MIVSIATSASKLTSVVRLRKLNSVPTSCMVLSVTVTPSASMPQEIAVPTVTKLFWSTSAVAVPDMSRLMPERTNSKVLPVTPSATPLPPSNQTPRPHDAVVNAPAEAPVM